MNPVNMTFKCNHCGGQSDKPIVPPYLWADSYAHTVIKYSVEIREGLWGDFIRWLYRIPKREFVPLTEDEYKQKAMEDGYVICPYDKI